MQTFTIHSASSASFLREKDIKIETHLGADGFASAKVRTTHSIGNPLYGVTMGLIPPPAFGLSRNSTKTSSDSPALADAIRGLHELADKSHVVGIMMPGGQIQFADSPIFEGGRPTLDRLGGAAVLDDLKIAANQVIALSTKK